MSNNCFEGQLLHFLVDGGVNLEQTKDLLGQRELFQRKLPELLSEGRCGPAWAMACANQIFTATSYLELYRIRRELFPYRMWFGGPVVPPVVPNPPAPGTIPVLPLRPGVAFVTDVGWTVGATTTPKKFLVDTGAQISCIDLANAKGCTVDGGASIGGATGSGEAIVVKGGKMEITFPGPPVVKRACDLPVAIVGQHILGTDQMKEMKLKINFDFSKTPPTIEIVPG
jgi:hypothetical protein